MGYILVTAVLVVSLGRLGDMLGRVRIYNLGFVIFTAASIALSLDPAKGEAGRPVADRLPAGPGHRRIHVDGQLGRHSHRRLPARTTWHGVGRQPDHGTVRSVRRAGGGRPAGGVGLESGVLGERTVRDLRHHLGLPQFAGDLGAGPGPDRLVGQSHLRPGPRSGSHFHHLRHPALSPLHHGVEQPQGCRRADAGRLPAGAVRR